MFDFDRDASALRVVFYGANDFAAGWHVRRVAELAEQFDPQNPPTSTEDILELHNVQRYLEHDFFPNDYTPEQRNKATARIAQIRSAVARFFSTIENTQFAAAVAGVGHNYHGDLLDLLGRYRAYERCDSATVLPALAAVGVTLGDLLANKKLVVAYDTEIRDALRGSSQGAEHLVWKYLSIDAREDVHLPPSFTPADARELLGAYVASENANPNYVRLIATAEENPQAGIDAKLKLHATRRGDEMTAELFAECEGIRTGCEVGISGNQDALVVSKMDTSDLVSKYTYSKPWLEESSDNCGILNNFQHLFHFVDRQVLLTLPSYPAHLAVMERLMGTTGKTEYKIGAVFRAIDMRTLLQTRMYHHYLEAKNIDLERVIAWFFEEYLVEDFGAANFSFTPSDRGTSYLQRVRHLFAEMESAASQFDLFAKDGELDHDLLAMRSAQARYKEIPSLLEGKYVYSSEQHEIINILQLLFSDQSSLNHINQNLMADDAASLILNNPLAYNDFENHQKSGIDHLIERGILEDTGTRVQFVNMERLCILKALFTTQAASYYHLSEAGRVEADAMVAKGWATRRSSLLTDAEAKYFNYFLNAVDFSNGPQLRNKYLHGSQGNGDDEDAHFRTYLTALRLTVALVIKINDDFCLAASESRAEGSKTE
ncbi:hypothetical protein [Mycobacteroides abscessus]|uniref:hypothetical protein n=1 Tax=Mycobacteroides abscessus TaxID=36809 RepID=UPI000241CFE5|nr:hypothetical protein [Mycobacteroides abscessus]EHM22336.1 hypothetical protein MBOL_12380 [Mycobacteroides abscessus subsp. bolletii BD]ORA29675.1 hypothetical protein BST18_07570 [Mycobacteroides abscessus subsp. bolletii]TPF67184.1 hypothetical protein XW60_16060 [Mycobacteroides abscessus subsp. bolletii]BBB40730.1 hypothetical protein MASB_12960 [Mycobacteroides abscessus subsp. bolletii BD]